MLGVHALTFGADTVQKITDMSYSISKIGYSLLEISIHNLSTLEGINLPEGIALSMSCGLDNTNDISSNELDIVNKGHKKLLDIAKIAHEHNIKYVTGVLYGSLGAHISKGNKDNSISVLKEVSKVFDKYGISLSLEVVNRYENNLLNTVEDAVDFVDKIDDKIGLHLDTYHMHIEETDMMTPVLLARERLKYIHIGESNRGYLGTGSVDFPNFFKALNLIKYNNPIVFEAFSAHLLDKNLIALLSIWDNRWKDSIQLVKHAYEYMSNFISR